MEGNFTEESRSLLISAKEEMYKLKHSYVGTEHLLLAILKSNLKNRLNKYNITYEIALKNIKKIVGVGTKETDLFLYTPVLKRIIENSIIDSKDNNTDVTPEILFLNFLEEGEGVGIRILLISNIDLDSIKIKGEIVTPLYTSNQYNETLPNDFLFLTGKITDSKLRIGTSFGLRRNNFDTVYETFKITIFFKFKNKDSYYKFTVYNWKYNLDGKADKFVYCKIDVPDFVNQIKSYTYNINDILIG